MKNRPLKMILICSVLALALTLTAAAQQLDHGTAEAARTAPVLMAPQAEGLHLKYMSCDSQGRFLPDQPLTRGELAQMLCDLVADRPATYPAFSDVDPGAWYAPAASTAAGLGLMADDYGFFRPADPVTRAECAYALSQLLPYDAPMVDAFMDIWPGHWAYQAVCRAAGQGLFQGDGTGRFRPNDGLTRCEAAAVFNRLLGRSPDLASLSRQTDLYAFSDVPEGHWAYGEIMEAAITHQYTAFAGGESWGPAQAEALDAQDPIASGAAGLSDVQDPGVLAATDAAGLPDGPQRIDGRLYWVVNGVFARDCSMEGLYFDENGWYSTGDSELDEMLNDIVNRLTDDSMTRDEKLRALYNYIRDNYTYLKRPLISKGQTGWEAEYAKYFLTNGRGNCYNFSAAYCLLCRELGLPAYVVVGSVLNSPHGWVEIQLDGGTYMFDTQLEWRYLHDWEKTGYDLFKMPPSRTPFQYTR